MKPLPPVSVTLAYFDEEPPSNLAKGYQTCLRVGIVSFCWEPRCEAVGVSVERVIVSYKPRNPIRLHR